MLSSPLAQVRNDLKACGDIFFGSPSGASGNEISVLQRPIRQLKTHNSKHNISVSVVNPIAHETPDEHRKTEFMVFFLLWLPPTQ